MNELIWSQEARSDLDRIADHYRQIDTALADIMIDRIIAAPAILLERPFLGAPIGAYKLHKWRVRETPYLLLYQAALRDIEIVRIRHEREDWQAGL